MRDPHVISGSKILSVHFLRASDEFDGRRDFSSYGISCDTALPSGGQGPKVYRFWQIPVLMA